jgi:hypothetical protein
MNLLLVSRNTRPAEYTTQKHSASDRAKFTAISRPAGLPKIRLPMCEKLLTLKATLLGAVDAAL